MDLIQWIYWRVPLYYVAGAMCSIALNMGPTQWHITQCDFMPWREESMWARASWADKQEQIYHLSSCSIQQARALPLLSTSQRPQWREEWWERESQNLYGKTEPHSHCTKERRRNPNCISLQALRVFIREKFSLGILAALLGHLLSWISIWPHFWEILDLLQFLPFKIQFNFSL